MKPVLEYCTENNIDFTYKKPDGDTDYARIAMLDVAVAEGYNIIVMPGYIFAPALVEVTYKYPDVKFIALDMTAGDIIAAAVGNKYYEDRMPMRLPTITTRKTHTAQFTRRRFPGIWQDMHQ